MDAGLALAYLIADLCGQRHVLETWTRTGAQLIGLDAEYLLVTSFAAIHESHGMVPWKNTVGRAPDLSGVLPSMWEHTGQADG